MKTSPMELQRCLASDRLHLILMPTEACNFRCVYCYESFALKRMEPWVVEATKRLLDRRWDRLRQLSISWFGGEPLLAADIVEDIQGHVVRLSRERGALAIDTDVTTNASLLTPELARRFESLGIASYQVTFDGPESFHDRKRVMAGGKPTFRRIWSNLGALRRSDIPFRITVRLHLDHENYPALDAFLSLYRAAFGADERFELFIRGLSRLGGPNDPLLQVLTGDDGARALEAARDRARKMGCRVTAPRSAQDICYAARANSFLIRADGRLNKCTVALDHPRKLVGRIREDGSLEVSGDRVRPWMRGLESGDRGELRCPMRGWADPVYGAMVGAPKSIPLSPSRAAVEVRA